MDALRLQLERDEGLRLKPYTDTLGKMTLGVGHNLDRPISERVARLMLDDDIADAAADLARALPWTDALDEPRRGALLNMAFNLGIQRLLSFHETLNLMRLGRFSEAADEMLQSLWATQVGDRAVRLARQVRTGTWQ